jgi:imidazolonepropionase-like amidohydrolase/ABC-type multidrug transport system permease subunit
MAIRSVLALTRAQLTEILRSKTAVFWILAFPIGFLFLFGYVMARGDARGTAFLLPGLLTTTLTSGALFNTVFPLVQQREMGLLRRLRLTPVSAAAVLISHGLVTLTASAASLATLMVLARLVFGAEMAGTPAALVAVFLCGAVALVPVGLIVASTARDLRTAPAIANLLFFPLMFLSGSAFPFAMLPDGVKRVARYLPTTYLNDAYAGVIVRGDGVASLAGPLVVLVGLGVVGTVMAAMLFRWEHTEPIPRRSLAILAVSFGVALSGAALAAPAIRMADMPGTRRIDPGAARGQVRVLRGMTVLDGLGRRIPNARVTIRDHVIRDVAVDDPAEPMPDGAIVEHLAGRFLIPGLIDSHVHWGGSGGAGSSPDEMSDARWHHDFGATLAAGVTSVVSLTDDLASMRSLSDAVASAAERAPRTFYSGPSITARGGHPAAMFSFLPGLAEQLTRQVETADDARAAIEELDRAHVDLVKLVLEPGFQGRPLPRLRDDVFLAAVAEARRRRMRTTVHVGTDADARLAIQAGADGLEHAARGMSDETMALMAAKRVTFTPTNVVLDYAWKRRILAGDDALVQRMVMPSLLAGLRRPGSPMAPLLAEGDVATRMAGALAGALDQTAKAARAGVPVLAGSDAGNPATFHGVAFIRELELLAQAGLPLGDVLRAATSRPAERLGANSIGRIASGATADLVVLRGDPLADVAAYRDVDAVYLGGRRLDPATLSSTSPGPWRFGR